MRGYIQRLNKDGKFVPLNISIHGDINRQITIYIHTDENFLMNDGQLYSNKDSFEISVTEACFDTDAITFRGFVEVRHNSNKHIWKDGFTFYTNPPV